MTLLLGNCIDHMHLMEDKQYDVIITDPMYHYSQSEKWAFHQEFIRVARGAIIVFAPPENEWVFPERGIKPDQILFWIKPISTKNTSKSYSRFMEMIFVYGRWRWNSKRHWSQYTNVFNDLVELRNHPYKKPYSLIKRLVLNHTDVGDTVYDPFAGSGTTLEVCRDTGRFGTGSEIDKVYYEMAKEAIG